MPKTVLPANPRNIAVAHFVEGTLFTADNARNCRTSIGSIYMRVIRPSDVGKSRAVAIYLTGDSVGEEVPLCLIGPNSPATAISIQEASKYLDSKAREIVLEQMDPVPGACI